MSTHSTVEASLGRMLEGIPLDIGPGVVDLFRDRPDLEVVVEVPPGWKPESGADR